MVKESQLHIIAVTGFIKKDGKFLILKRSEKEIANPGEWTVPGGKLEGTDSIEATLKKEVSEETGLKITGPATYIGDTEFTRPDGYHVVIPRFLVEEFEGEVKIDSKDFTDYAWVNKDSINEYKVIEGVKAEILELLK